MKKLFILLVLAIAFLPVSNLFAQGDAETVAKEVIKAYKTQDVDLLKKYMTGMMMYVINDEFFNSDDAKPLVKAAKNWNNKIKEIRYSKGDIMGKKVLLASAYFNDNENGNLDVVILSSFEKSDWKAFAYGITDVSKEEYEQGSTEIPGDEVSEEDVVKDDFSDFTIEMANGDKIEKPSKEKLVDLLKTLDDDNFFLILNGKNGFLQTSTSDNGFIVQYSENETMKEAEEYFNMDQLKEIFIVYLSNGNWKEKANWVDM